MVPFRRNEALESVLYYRSAAVMVHMLVEMPLAGRSSGCGRLSRGDGDINLGNEELDDGVAFGDVAGSNKSALRWLDSSWGDSWSRWLG
jgi:hypothetical protein